MYIKNIMVVYKNRLLVHKSILIVHLFFLKSRRKIVQMLKVYRVFERN